MNLTAETALHNGKYILKAQLGKGIFGITYRATNTESSETVVIKTLAETLRQHSDVDQFKQKFLKLGDRLSSCKHPNLVQVLDSFEDAGRPYLVMEYIPGQTLAELIQSAALPETKAIEYIRQIGDALSVLHQANLLHLNVRPQNIIRRPDSDRVVLCEFGIVCEFTAGIMQTHASLVSAGYAPIELYSFKALRSPATDIYALAATFYCLLTGRPPLSAPVRKSLLSKESVNTVAGQRQRLFISDGHSSIPKLSLGAKQAIVHGLQMVAPRRPQTVADWLDLLNSQEKISGPQLIATQHSMSQPSADTQVPTLEDSVQADLKSALIKCKIPQRGQEKQLIPQPTLAQSLVTQSEPENQNGRLALKKPKTPNIKWLLQALLITGAIATSAGLGFGFALRINGSAAPGSTILHTKQSFPPSRHWPNSEPQIDPSL